MASITIKEARANLDRLIDEAATSHEPLLIVGKGNSAVLVAQEDWAAVQEPCSCFRSRRMRESVREGLATHVAGCDEALNW